MPQPTVSEYVLLRSDAARAVRSGEPIENVLAVYCDVITREELEAVQAAEKRKTAIVTDRERP